MRKDTKAALWWWAFWSAITVLAAIAGYLTQ